MSDDTDPLRRRVAQQRSDRQVQQEADEKRGKELARRDLPHWRREIEAAVSRSKWLQEVSANIETGYVGSTKKFMGLIPKSTYMSGVAEASKIGYYAQEGYIKELEQLLGSPFRVRRGTHTYSLQVREQEIDNYGNLVRSGSYTVIAVHWS